MDSSSPVVITRALEDEHLAHDPLPSCLSTTGLSSFLDVDADKLEARYVGHGAHGHDVGAIQGDRPVPRDVPVYYFEVTVLSAGESGKIGVGFADSAFKLSRQPGWEPNSYGYHGDDGKRYHNSSRGEEYGPTFSTGDVVGCGIHFQRAEVFFTKNGRYLGVAFRGVRARMVPTVGAHSRGERIRINFGNAPFAFNLEEWVHEDRQRHLDAIRNIPIPAGAMHRLVRGYLVAHGYRETLVQLDAATGAGGGRDAGAGAETSGAEAAIMNDAADIRQRFLAGDVAGVRAILKEWYPSLLSDPRGRVPFVLAAQEFIEHVRRGQALEAALFARGAFRPFLARAGETGGDSDAGGGASPACGRPAAESGGDDGGGSGGPDADITELCGLLAYRDHSVGALSPLMSRRQQARGVKSDAHRALYARASAASCAEIAKARSHKLQQCHSANAAQEDPSCGGSESLLLHGHWGSALEGVVRHVFAVHEELRESASGGHGERFALQFVREESRRQQS